MHSLQHLTCSTYFLSLLCAWQQHLLLPTLRPALLDIAPTAGNASLSKRVALAKLYERFPVLDLSSVGVAVTLNWLQSCFSPFIARASLGLCRTALSAACRS
jgi:hypothetical protein